MPIFVGDTEPVAIYVGSTPVLAVFVGSVQVWPEPQPPELVVLNPEEGEVFVDE